MSLHAKTNPRMKKSRNLVRRTAQGQEGVPSEHPVTSFGALHVHHLVWVIDALQDRNPGRRALNPLCYSNFVHVAEGSIDKKPLPLTDIGVEL